MVRVVDVSVYSTEVGLEGLAEGTDYPLTNDMIQP
jgi:hypothetical protein